MSLGAVRVLGWLVIAHGLSHAVLPLRGSLGPLLIDDWVPVGLYAVGMVGFVAAGVGLLGLRPLDRAISPLLVLASGLSLVAIVRFGDASLWFGASLDVALLLIGLWRAYGGWPAHPVRGHAWHVAGLAAGLALLLYVGATSFFFPWHRAWGSTRDEILMALPGDPPQRNLALEVQHAVTVQAPPAEVWTVLCETIQRRGMPVRTVFDSEHALVVDGVGTYVVRPLSSGQTRLIFRSLVGDHHMPVWASALSMVLELPTSITERRLMLTVKSLAEAHGTTRSALIF